MTLIIPNRLGDIVVSALFIKIDASEVYIIYFSMNIFTFAHPWITCLGILIPGVNLLLLVKINTLKHWSKEKAMTEFLQRKLLNTSPVQIKVCDKFFLQFQKKISSTPPPLQIKCVAQWSSKRKDMSTLVHQHLHHHHQKRYNWPIIYYLQIGDWGLVS